MVEEVATAAAEEANNRPGGWRLCSVFYFTPIFVTVTTTATEGGGNGAVSSRKINLGPVVLIAVIDASLLASALLSLQSSLLCPSLFPPLSTLPLL
jgi:hypothetical protein